MSKKVINRDKNGNLIPDLSKVKLPEDIEVSILKILNPNLNIEKVKFVS